MRTDNDLLREANRLVDIEMAEIELAGRNEKNFKHWAKHYYHRYHKLPVKTPWVSQ